MWLYAISIFIGAFLLFQIQPMIAKMILPWFGGSAAVWITCLLFFQSMLLAGYLYAHVLVQFLKPSAQAALHALLLAASLTAVPVGPALSWKPSGHEEPVLHILGLLTVSIGLPYVLLSATSPLLQAWYARQCRSELPYRLFALSNFASLLGLLAYPFLVEPLFPLAVQSWAWSAGYVLWAGLVIGTAATGFRKQAEAAAPAPAEDPGGAAAPALSERILWLAFSCCGVVLLLAVTHHLTQNITSIPFLWILPLSLYLLSFIICFSVEPAYTRSLYLGPLAIVLVALMYGTLRYDSTTRLSLVIGFFSFGLFMLCMFCHGELARRKPSPKYLTSFYLMIAVGGALGGLLVGAAAPLLFRGYMDMPLAVAACTILLLCAHWRESWQSRLIAGLLCVGMAAGTGYYLLKYSENVAAMERNFYGSLRVMVANRGSEFESHVLIHGSVAHGVQFMDSGRRRDTTAYYGPNSGAALVLGARGDRPLRVGLVGLGIGTLAAYSRPGDVYRCYEINPLVVKLAREQFSFLADAPARIELVMGDARLALERESNQDYDVLVVDAFSGDAIPVHLLTREALQLYFRHLKPDGVLALHLTNNHIDLVPVADQLARALGKHAVLVESELDEEREIYNADWVLMSSHPLKDPQLEGASQPLRSRPGQRPWTDDFSNLFQILK